MAVLSSTLRLLGLVNSNSSDLLVGETLVVKCGRALAIADPGVEEEKSDVSLLLMDQPSLRMYWIPKVIQNSIKILP